MAPKRLSRSKGPLRKAGHDMLKGKPELLATKAIEKGPSPVKAKAATGTSLANEESAKLFKLLEDIFKCYDQDEDGQIERVEWLDGEEKRHARFDFGPKVRRAAVAWFKEAGAEGNVNDGMYLTFEKFKTAYLATAVQESGIPESEPLKLSAWIMQEKAQALLQACRQSTPPAAQNTSEILPGTLCRQVRAPPSYPLTCPLPDLLNKIEEAREFGKMILVLQSGNENVETFFKYRNYLPIDSKQILSEMLIRKSKSKEECAAEVGSKLRKAMCMSPGCDRPIWIHMSNCAFDWNSFCCDEFPDEVFSGSRWTTENAIKRGMIDDMCKLQLGGNWREFHVIITSRFDLEGAEMHLKDKIPFYDELAIIVVDPASMN